MVEWTPDLAYVTGALLGDGFTQGNRVSLEVIDKDFRDAVASRLKGRVRSFTREKYRTFYNLYTCNGGLRLFLQQLRHCPWALLGMSGDSARWFLAGFFDAEGHNHMAPCGFLKVNQREVGILKVFSEWLRRFGIRHSLAANKDYDKEIWRIYMCGKENMARFFELVPVQITRKRSNA